MVGVIDVKKGQAVHAVAGRRDRYAPVRVVAGDPIDLARQYHDLGIRRIYIADLDAIEHSRAEVELLVCLMNRCRAFQETIIDIGWNGDASEISSLISSDHPSMRWVVSTESAPSHRCLRDACKVIQPNRVLLGLDYRQGQLVSQSDDEIAWVEASRGLGLGGVVVLDLADVGTGSGGSTAPICKRIRRSFHRSLVYSGGGIRKAENAQSLFHAGCDLCLVATSIHTLMNHR